MPDGPRARREPGLSFRLLARRGVPTYRSVMIRLLCALASVLPLAAAAQSLRGPNFGEAMRTMDALQSRPGRGLDQALVLPERPGQNQVAWYDFNWQYVDVPPPGGGKGGIRLYYYR